MKDQVKAAVTEGSKVTHITFNGNQHQLFPSCHQPALCQLLGRIVEYGNVRPSCCQDGTLLAAARSQAQDVYPMDILGEPGARYRLFLRKQYRPLPQSDRKSVV